MRIVEGLDYVHLEGDTYPIEDILGVLGAFVQQGKVRFIGLSNETPWGDDLPQSVRDPWPAADRLDPERL
jgi:aryl-alcohol dehydrogenase-like predicted oxidoreductase